jgi:membrane protease YdiL (CAAX protease family)
MAGTVVAILFARALIAGLVVAPHGVEVRGVWRTHRVPAAQVAGVVMEVSPGDRWLMPSIVTTDGRFHRARWAVRPARGQAVTTTATGVAAQLAGYGGIRADLRSVLDARGAEVRGFVVDVPVVAARDVAPDAVAVDADAPPHLDMRYRLDREVAAGLPASSWGFGEVVKAIIWLAGMITLYFYASDVIGATAANSVGEASIGLAVVLAGRKAAKQSGGWRKALGWDLPKLTDVWLALRWFGIQMLGSIAAGLFFYLVLMPFGGSPNESNVDLSANDSVVRIVVGALTAVVMAPIVEEFLFRGLVLRATMRRFPFWPAAIVNAVLFGAAHAHQVATWQGKVDLAGTIAVFGFIQCLLVRRTGRLGPPMIVHGVLNALALTIALTT